MPTPARVSVFILLFCYTHWIREYLRKIYIYIYIYIYLEKSIPKTHLRCKLFSNFLIYFYFYFFLGGRVHFDWYTIFLETLGTTILLPLQFIYTDFNFGHNLWDKIVVLLGTTLGAHWELESLQELDVDISGNLMGIHWA